MPETNPSERKLTAALSRVEARMRRELESADPLLGQSFSTFNRGKKIRVRLTLLAALASGRITAKVERLAAAMEFFHYATLIHDDIIDNSRQRRHHPTLNARFGNETAVMLGDLMFTRVMNILIRDMPRRVQELAAQTASRVCQGELQEITVRGDLELNQKLYEEIISRKTAWLFASCAQCGGILAGATPAQSRALRDYGWSLGMAFQIRDDLLDLFGESRRVGKKVGTDLKEGRITLPVILGLRSLQGQARNRLAAAVAGGKAIAEICRRLEACGAKAGSENRARHFALRAETAALKLPVSQAREDMIRLARFAAERNY